MKELVIPAVALLGGILALFVDPKHGKTRGVVLLLLMGIAGLSMAYNLQDSREKALALVESQANEEMARKDLDAIIDYMKLASEKVGLLVSNGMKPETAKAATPDQVDFALSADALYQKYLETQAKEANAKLKVVYLPKGVDKSRVFKSVQDLGITVNLGPPLNDGETNVMWVGPEVPLDSAKAVAFALMRAGVKVAAIRSNERRARDSRLIEIGSDPGLVSRASRSPAEIEAMTAITRSP